MAAQSLDNGLMQGKPNIEERLLNHIEQLTSPNYDLDKRRLGVGRFSFDPVTVPTSRFVRVKKCIVWDHYQLMEEVGRGGFGCVRKAVCKSSG